MPNETSLPPPGEAKRSPLWPWLLMPLAALALFVTLSRVRHAAEAALTGAGADMTRDGGD
jgi:hypothetical protein